MPPYELWPCLAFFTLVACTAMALPPSPRWLSRLVLLLGLVGASGLVGLALNGLPPFTTPIKYMMPTGYSWNPVQVTHKPHWIGVVLTVLVVLSLESVVVRAFKESADRVPVRGLVHATTVFLMMAAWITAPYAAPMARHVLGSREHWRFRCVTTEGAHVDAIAPNLDGVRLESMWLQDATDPHRVWHLNARECTYFREDASPRAEAGAAQPVNSR